MIAGRFFVTPHAVERFRQRIAPHLTYEQALGAIIRGLDATDSEPKPAHSGTGYYIRVRRPYAFRALIVPGEGPLPAVATVLRSGKGRGGRRRRCTATGHRLDCIVDTQSRRRCRLDN